MINKLGFKWLSLRRGIVINILMHLNIKLNDIVLKHATCLVKTVPLGAQYYFVYRHASVNHLCASRIENNIGLIYNCYIFFINCKTMLYYVL